MPNALFPSYQIEILDELTAHDCSIDHLSSRCGTTNNVVNDQLEALRRLGLVRDKTEKWGITRLGRERLTGCYNFLSNGSTR